MVRFLFLLLALLPAQALAQMPQHGEPARALYFRGAWVTCQSNRGEPVVFVANYYLPDVGVAKRGPYGPFVEYNPQIFLPLAPEVQMFWFGHECGHHALGHTDPYGNGLLNANRENEADCYAGRFLARHGVPRASMPLVWQSLMGLWPSYAGHAPGPQRAAQTLSCYDAEWQAMQSAY